MSQQPLLDFLYTLPAFIAKAPPVIGVSDNGRVKLTLRLDRQLTDIAVDAALLPFPLDLRSRILAAISNAQELRNKQVQDIISRHSRAAQLSLWDVEGTLLAVRGQQSVFSTSFQGIGRNHLVSVVRDHQAQIDRLVLNSVRVRDRRELERSIIEAAQQGYDKVRYLQKTLPFADLISI
jgi:DNA-binding protein YbaB